jgi:hypothetical protein
MEKGSKNFELVHLRRSPVIPPSDIEDLVLAQKHMGERIPTSTLLLETQILQEVTKRMPPLLTKAGLY